MAIERRCERAPSSAPRIRDFRKSDATIQTVLKHAFTIVFLLAAVAAAQDQKPAAQDQKPAAQQPESKPQVKVNYLNVCTPDTEEQTIIKGALASVQPKPAFSTDFE